MNALDYGMLFFVSLAIFCFMGVLSGFNELVVYVVVFFSAVLILLTVSIELENYGEIGWK